MDEQVDAGGKIALRPFGEGDFARLISWVPTPEAHGEWCGGFFAYPLDEAQLARYLDSARQPNVREIFIVATPAGEAVGHVEISHIWPHLSSRLSRVIVAPERRRVGFGRAVVAAAAALSFDRHRVARIDLGVSASNRAAIACYASVGFAHVGTWPHAIETAAAVIDVYWMTLERSSRASNRPDSAPTAKSSAPHDSS